MRLDEDVGKVASVVPFMVSKAIELFLENLLDACVVEMNATHTTKLSAGHLKRTVANNEKFDFLKDIVEKLPDDIPKAADSKSKAEGKRGRSAAAKNYVISSEEEGEEGSTNKDAISSHQGAIKQEHNQRSPLLTRETSPSRLLPVATNESKRSPSPKRQSPMASPSNRTSDSFKGPGMMSILNENTTTDE